MVRSIQREGGQITSSQLLALIVPAFTPPSDKPCWQWIEENCEIIKSDFPGKVNLDFFPGSKQFFAFASDPRTRSLILLVCAQAGKTENATMFLCWRIKEKPHTIMWVTASKESMAEFTKKRLNPILNKCRGLDGIRPVEGSGEWTESLIQFATCNLIKRGAKSLIGLQSDPVGVVVCDERREWEQGRIHVLRMRMTAIEESIEISVGTAGRLNDDLHNDWKRGSQTFIHWHCSKCNHSQPFRFGRKASVLWPEERERGGIVWPTNEITKPNGVWNLKAVEDLARYECEKCGEQFTNTQKFQLLKSWHPHHRNPDALPDHPSLHYNQLYLPWKKTTFGYIAAQFLDARRLKKLGEPEKWQTFIKEVLGEPLDTRGKGTRAMEAKSFVGEYDMGDYWPHPSDPSRIHPDTALVLTGDCQKKFGGYIVWVIRQWHKSRRADGTRNPLAGQSRMVDCGIAQGEVTGGAGIGGEKDLIQTQHQYRIPSGPIFLDEAWNTDKVRTLCNLNQWGTMRGSKYELLNSDQTDENGKQIKTPWKIEKVGIQGAQVDCIVFSTRYYKEIVYHQFIPGAGPLWQVPRNAPDWYMRELGGHQWTEEPDGHGGTSGEWREIGIPNAGDCEIEQAVAADYFEIVRLPKKL